MRSRTGERRHIKRGGTRSRKFDCGTTFIPFKNQITTPNPTSEGKPPFLS